jgi:hypothetical protein
MADTNLEQLQDALTTIVQNLRALDDGDAQYRDITNRVHSLCDAIETNAEIGRVNAMLGLQMMRSLSKLVDTANKQIQARKPLQKDQEERLS